MSPHVATHCQLFEQDVFVEFGEKPMGYYGKCIRVHECASHSNRDCRAEINLITGIKHGEVS